MRKSLASSKLKLVPTFPKQVSLYEWWLIKANKPSDGRVLGVGGLSSNEQLGIRTLHSAAIVKRHNANVVETEDGLTITFSGSINKLRTVLNGFSPEVCNQFIFGFPYSWEEFSSESFKKEASNSAADNSVHGVNNLPKSLDNLPGALIRDIFLSRMESPGTVKIQGIFEDMLQTYGGESLDQRAEIISPSKEINPVTRDYAEDETSSDDEKSKQKQQEDENDSSAGAKPRKKLKKSARELGVSTSRRSMHHLEKSQSTKSASLSDDAPLEEPHGGGFVTGRNRSSMRSKATSRRLTLRNRSIDFNVEDV